MRSSATSPIARRKARRPAATRTEPEARDRWIRGPPGQTGRPAVLGVAAGEDVRVGGAEPASCRAMPVPPPRTTDALELVQAPERLFGRDRRGFPVVHDPRAGLRARPGWRNPAARRDNEPVASRAPPRQAGRRAPAPQGGSHAPLRTVWLARPDPARPGVHGTGARTADDHV